MLLEQLGSSSLWDYFSLKAVIAAKKWFHYHGLE